MYTYWQCQVIESTGLTFLDFFPTLLALLLPYSISKFSTLLVYQPLFSGIKLITRILTLRFPKKIPTLFVYLGILVYEIYIKYPLYSFICAYLFNWHLRVLEKRQRNHFNTLCTISIDQCSKLKQMLQCSTLLEFSGNCDKVLKNPAL